MNSPFRLWAKLRNRRYRRAFVRAHVRQGIAFQIQSIRKGMKLSQAQLQDLSDVPQASISRAEDPNYGKLSLSTLFGIVDGFDAALIVRIVPFSELVRDYAELTAEKSNRPVASFDEEDAKAKNGNLALTAPPPREIHTDFSSPEPRGRWYKAALAHAERIGNERLRESLSWAH